MGHAMIISLTRLKYFPRVKLIAALRVVLSKPYTQDTRPSVTNYPTCLHDPVVRPIISASLEPFAW